MQNDLISVVIPCYNQAHFLDSAIASVQKQTHCQTEIIVVDDGSTDNTFETASKYRNLRVIRQSNQGLSSARNTGLRASRGYYIVFLDADDRLLPEALEAGLRCIKKHPEVAFVYGGYKVVFHGGPPHPEPILNKIKRNYYKEILRGNFIGMHASILYKTGIFDIVGGFDPSLKACEDYDLYCRILKNFPIHFHDEIVAEYHRHDANMSINAGLMLDTSMKILKSQKAYVGKRPQYKTAYQHGINWWHTHYGAPLVLNIQRHIASRRFKQATIDLKILLKHYPHGIPRAFSPILYSGTLGAADAVREASRYLKRRLTS
jgi:glycosyltransferase involved in cell wall biosynthesis